MRYAIHPLAIILCALLFLTGCVAGTGQQGVRPGESSPQTPPPRTAEPEAPLALIQAPEDRAILLVYAAPLTGAAALFAPDGYWDVSPYVHIQGHGNQWYSGGTISYRQDELDGRGITYGRAAPRVIQLLPGTYELHIHSISGTVCGLTGCRECYSNHRRTLNARPGSVYALRVIGSCNRFSSEFTNWAQVRADGHTQLPEPIRLDERTNLSGLGSPRRVEGLVQNGCPSGDFRLFWENAVFDGRAERCGNVSGTWHMAAQGTLAYTDGPELTGRFTHQMVPESHARLSNDAGKSYSGGLRRTGSNQNGAYPGYQPQGVGHLRDTDGRIIFGHFNNGRPHGLATCVTGSRIEACRFRNGHSVPVDVTEPPRHDGEAALQRVAAGLDRQVGIDLLRRELNSAALQEDWPAYIQTLEELRDLQVPEGREALFLEARAYSSTGNHEAALDRLMAYINVYGQSGANYANALNLLAGYREQAETARAARRQSEESARSQRLELCGHFLAQGEFLCGCREFQEQLSPAPELLAQCPS